MVANNNGSNYLKTLLDNVTANGDGPLAELAFFNTRGMYTLCQVSGIGTATVTIKGRINSSHTWKTVTSFTSDDAVEVVLFPEMIATVSGYASGTILCTIIAQSRR